MQMYLWIKKRTDAITSWNEFKGELVKVIWMEMTIIL